RGTATASTRWPSTRISRFGLEWDIEPAFLDWVRMAYEPDNNIMNAIVLGPYCGQSGCGRRVGFEAFLVGAGHAVQHRESPCKNCGRRVHGEPIETPLATLKREVFREAQRLHRNGKLIRGGA